jgi:glycosyltransferase involved in cell wall biosynthesis
MTAPLRAPAPRFTYANRFAQAAYRLTVGIKWEFAEYAATLISKMAPALLFLGYRIARLVGLKGVACRMLLSASRTSNSERYTDVVREKLYEIQAQLPSLVSQAPAVEEIVTRCIVLREPTQQGSRHRKGVLLITFTRSSAFFFRELDLGRLTAEYHIVLEPSWAGYGDADILCWTTIPERILVQAPERRDRIFLSSLASNLVPADFGAGDWVDHRIFRPLPGVTKRFDAAYVANFGRYKRVHVFLRTLARVARTRPHFTAALVFGAWGTARAQVDALLDFYGVRDRVTVFERLSPEGVNEVYAQSRFTVLLALKEGSNRALFESMFADVPVVVLQENIGVKKEHINGATGVLCPERMLVDAFVGMSERAERFSPRAWALENISPAVTTQRLWRLVAEIEGAADSPALKVKTNAPEVRYFSDSEDHRVAVRRILATFRATARSQGALG